MPEHASLSRIVALFHEILDACEDFKFDRFRHSKTARHTDTIFADLKEAISQIEKAHAQLPGAVDARVALVQADELLAVALRKPNQPLFGPGASDEARQHAKTWWNEYQTLRRNIIDALPLIAGAAVVTVTYDPTQRQPRTIAELERWILADKIRTHPSAIQVARLPVVSLSDPPIAGLNRLSAYCRTRFDMNFADGMQRMKAAIVMALDCSEQEVSQLSIKEAADAIAGPPAMEAKPTSSPIQVIAEPPRTREYWLGMVLLEGTLAIANGSTSHSLKNYASHTAAKHEAAATQDWLHFDVRQESTVTAAEDREVMASCDAAIVSAMSSLKNFVNAVRLGLGNDVWENCPYLSSPTFPWNSPHAVDWKRLEPEINYAIEESKKLTQSPPAASVVPNPESKKGEEGPLPDGFYGAFGFRYLGKEVEFKKAALRYALVRSLWDSEANKPLAKPIETVMRDVWGENHNTEDAAFRQLVAATNRDFQREAFALRIVYGSGQVELKPQ